MKKTYICILHILLACFAVICQAQENVSKPRNVENSLSLKQFLIQSKPGDFIVTKIANHLTLIHLHSKSSESVIFEEISFSNKALPNIQNQWATWVKNKAPGHLSWSITELDLNSSEVLECFSISKNMHIQLSSKENLIATLLGQKLEQVPLLERRKIGPPPLDDSLDIRKIWTPPFVFEGKRVNTSQSIAYQTTWPKDDSELSERKITLYFLPSSPIHLPIWIEVETTHISGQIQVIDSGENLSSPYKNIQKRAPKITKIENLENSLKISFHSPKYLKEFSLFAIFDNSEGKEIFPILNFSKNSHSEGLALEIEKSELASIPKNSNFKIMIYPLGYDDLSEISPSIFKNF